MRRFLWCAVIYVVLTVYVLWRMVLDKVGFLLRRFELEVCDSLGWFFCEIAFQCDMRWGTERLYTVGSWFYSRGLSR